MTKKTTMWREAAIAALVVAGAAGLAACGGSGEQVEEFRATRILSFGDENSVLNADGTKYSINALNNAGVLDCTANPLWNQLVAASFGLVFPQCPQLAASAPVVADPGSRIYAQVGARAADLAGQVDQAASAASGAFGEGDMATVLVGANDIVAQYQQSPAVDEATLTANVEAAAVAVGAQVNRLADAGVKVIVSTAPNMGLSPYAGDPLGANAALLDRLSGEFNIRLRRAIYNDGRRIGLVILDEWMRGARIRPGLYGFVNTTQAACLPTAPLPTCTTATLGTNGAASSPASASATTWMWADDRRFSPGLHNAAGALARQRLENNPF